MTQTLDSFFGPMPGLPDPELDRQFYAGVPGRRFAAWIVDVVLVALVSLVLIPVFGLLTLGLGFFVAPLLFMAIGFAYRVTTVSGRSATLGMRLMGIELRRGDGRRFDLGYATLHTALYTATVMLPVLLLASAVTALGTRYQQTLPDLLLRTTAINPPED
jgi:uncharacterized RDD family membrane protein YckC